jgi:hypothetical protein
MVGVGWLGERSNIYVFLYLCFTVACCIKGLMHFIRSLIYAPGFSEYRRLLLVLYYIYAKSICGFTDRVYGLSTFWV